MMLEVKNLKVAFRTDEGRVQAVNGVDFRVDRGLSLGIVGESGSGKSVSAKAVMGLLPRSASIAEESSIKFERKDGKQIEITELKPKSRDMRGIRGGEIGMIFQEPMSAFSPVYTIGSHMIEAIRTHLPLGRREARDMAIDMLNRVGIANPKVRIDQYPFELSGGMRQRALTAIALAVKPSLLIADEPTTALDSTIQAQVLELMAHLQDDFDMALIFISHNLGVISQIADEVAVMYLGQIMERGTVREVIRTPRHPYTRSLLEAVPRLSKLGSPLTAVGGDIPSPLEHPTGCPFHPRCARRKPGLCDVERPAAAMMSPTHEVNCFLYE